MSDTADHLEREVETHRANVEDALDKLKGRLSVDQVVDDIGQFVGLEDVRGTLALAGRQVRENPLAIGLIGIGLAWLLVGRGASEQGPSDDSRTGRHDGTHSDVRPGARHPQDAAPRRRVSHEAEGDTLGKAIAEGAAGITGKVGALAQDLADRVEHAAAGATGRVKDLGAEAAERVHAGSLIRTIGRRIERQPLLLGGIALIAGALIGAALPRTRTEDRLLGDPRDRRLQDAHDDAQGLKDRATETAQRSYEAAVKAAEDEGLAPLVEVPAPGRTETVTAAAMGKPVDQADPDRTDADDGESGVRQSRAMRGRT